PTPDPPAGPPPVPPRQPAPAPPRTKTRAPTHPPEPAFSRGPPRFGNRANSESPLALRPRLATGLPLSVDSRLYSIVNPKYTPDGRTIRLPNGPKRSLLKVPCPQSTASAGRQ